MNIQQKRDLRVDLSRLANRNRKIDIEIEIVYEHTGTFASNYDAVQPVVSCRVAQPFDPHLFMKKYKLKIHTHTHTHTHTNTHTHTHTYCILPRCSALWCAPVHGTYLRHGPRGTYLYQIWDIKLGGHVWGMELEGQIWTRRNRRTNLRYGIQRTYLGYAFTSTYLDTELGGQI